MEIYDDRDVTLIVLDPGKSFGGFQSQKGRTRINYTGLTTDKIDIFKKQNIAKEESHETGKILSDDKPSELLGGGGDLLEFS